MAKQAEQAQQKAAPISPTSAPVQRAMRSIISGFTFSTREMPAASSSSWACLQQQ
jgi:hypothetical protein